MDMGKSHVWTQTLGGKTYCQQFKIIIVVCPLNNWPSVLSEFITAPQPTKETSVVINTDGGSGRINIKT